MTFVEDLKAYLHKVSAAAERGRGLLVGQRLVGGQLNQQENRANRREGRSPPPFRRPDCKAHAVILPAWVPTSAGTRKTSGIRPSRADE